MRITRTLQRAALGAGALALAAGLAACGSGSGGSMDDGAAKDGSSSMQTSDGGGDAGMTSDGGGDMSGDMGSDMGGDMAMSMAHGTFAGANGKSVAGKVSIEDGKLMLTGFSSDQGPDLHLYLAEGDDEDAVDSGMELGDVAYDSAEQTFSVEGVDLSQYDHVVVHCDKAKAVFGSAALS
ncbi:DM13 domain-containing protein [Brachybacterium halotolerans subsp. kimchii]|uniref:DM13 domain-containing protein n=1 Tax=Brachybacterium halotolerans TaxID=2795215 RepID=UPI001E3C73D1|nr:DM13 domain-containing protein [Brachybacterium halotolerans]UEJ82011.1 DM13 domain-containing protein [Brachybacterium halotolerans subsp. kimchii]